MKTQKTDQTRSKANTNPTAFDYAKLKAQANDHEREGRWTEAAQVWTEVAEQAPNKMIVDHARRRAQAALANARAQASSSASDATDATDSPEAPHAPTDAPGEDSAPIASPAPTDAPTGEPDAKDAPSASTAPASPAPKPRDARLPEVGTVIQKRDRKGELRCECRVVDGGIEYQGTTYKSLSAAALAASKDLGLGAETLDGWAWWGLKTRPAVPGAKKDLVVALDRAFAKYRERADQVVKGASGDDLAKVKDALGVQGAALLAMAESASS